ncbi:MAG: hypothetical protein ACK2U2_10200 [Anaerolineae bacterium]
MDRIVDRSKPTACAILAANTGIGKAQHTAVTAMTESRGEPVGIMYCLLTLSKTGASQVALDREGMLQCLKKVHAVHHEANGLAAPAPGYRTSRAR